MAHPRMYSDEDPLLARLRKACERFPESQEVEAWGRPTFRAGKKIYAVYGSGQEKLQSIIFKPAPEERQGLMDDKRMFVPPYFGPAGWLAIDLLNGKVNWKEINELLEDSYRSVALQRMLKVLDS